MSTGPFNGPAQIHCVHTHNLLTTAVPVWVRNRYGHLFGVNEVKWSY